MSPSASFTEDDRKPWVTGGLLLVLIAIFIGERLYAVTAPASFMPSTPTLIALGGVNRTLMLTQGEWYRLFTAGLLHGSLPHLLGNSVSLLLAGIFLEKLIGHLWFFAIFTVGVLGCSLLSWVANDAGLTSVGASGGIMALFAAMFTCSFRLPQGARRRQLQIEAVRMMIPALLPFLAGSGGLPVDYAGHLGGALAGLLMGMILLSNWPEHERWPDLHDVAALIAGSGLLLFIASTGAALHFYPHYRDALAGLMPETVIPKTVQEQKDQSSDLIQRYPLDPRSHMYRAQALLGYHDTAGARREMIAAQNAEQRLSFVFGSKWENAVHASIAALWLTEGKQAEARAQFKPLCSVRPDERPPGKIYDELVTHHLCD